nr:Gag-Pol polyprotein [Tanacetum cinerariifolium]
MNELEQVKKKKDGLDSKLTGFESASKDLDTLLGIQRSDKNKEDDTITDYSRPTPSIEINTSDLQNNNPSVSEHGESSSSNMSKPMIKFIKATDCPEIIKTNKVETARKPSVKYAEMYRNTSKSPNVMGNQRNWNNLKSQQLGKYFLMKNKAFFKCGDFDHLAYDCGVWVEKGKNWSKNNFAHKDVTPRANLFKKASVSAARRVNNVVPRPNVNSARPKTTYDLVIIKLIQRVKRLERELKARTPPTKIQKVDVRADPGLTKKIMKTMNMTFDELSTMDFEQRNSKIGIQGMTYGQISLGLELTYASSTITTQKPTERELDLLFESMYDDYICGQPSAAIRTALAAQATQVLHTLTASTIKTDTAPTKKFHPLKLQIFQTL